MALGGTVVVFAVVNHFKYVLTGDFFYPWDMVQAGNIGELSGFVSAGFPLKYVLSLLSILLLALLPLLGNATLPLRAYVRLPGGCTHRALHVFQREHGRPRRRPIWKPGACRR